MNKLAEDIRSRAQVKLASLLGEAQDPDSTSERVSRLLGAAAGAYGGYKLLGVPMATLGAGVGAGGLGLPAKAIGGSDAALLAATLGIILGGTAGVAGSGVVGAGLGSRAAGGIHNYIKGNTHE